MRKVPSFGLLVTSIVFVTSWWTWQHRGPVISQELLLRLPPDIESRALAQFDEQVALGNIFYDDSAAEVLTDKGFRFEFRIVPIFEKKPVLKAGDPDRAKAFEPFVHPHAEDLVAELGQHHSAILNLYALYRPMLVLPTKTFAPQTNDLDAKDLTAAWSLLRAFSTPSIVFYNCGAEAGSSQGHKHMQMVPLPAQPLWPSKVQSSSEIVTSIEAVPFKHAVLRLRKSTTLDQLFEAHERLLRSMLQQTGSATTEDLAYNVAMTTDWIAVIPRRVPHGPFGANALGMLGLVSVSDEAERQRWTRLGLTEYLAELGFPL